MSVKWYRYINIYISSRFIYSKIGFAAVVDAVVNDLSDLACKIEELGLLSRVNYPNSKFSFVRITNVSFFVTKVLRCPIGAPTDLPPYLKNNKGLISLVSYHGTP